MTPQPFSGYIEYSFQRKTFQNVYAKMLTYMLGNEIETSGNIQGCYFKLEL